MTDYTSWVNQAKASQMTGGLIPHPLAGPMEGGPFNSPMDVALFGRSASSSTSSSSFSSSSGSSSAGGGLGAILFLLFIFGAFSGSGDKNKSGASTDASPRSAVVQPAAQPSSAPTNLAMGATTNDAGADLPTAVMTATGNLRVKNEDWILIYNSPSEDDFKVSLPARDRAIKKIGRTADGWYELEIQTSSGIERGFSKTDIPRPAKPAASRTAAPKPAAPKPAPQPAAPKRTSSASAKRPAPDDLHAANQGRSLTPGERAAAADGGGARTYEPR